MNITKKRIAILSITAPVLTGIIVALINLFNEGDSVNVNSLNAQSSENENKTVTIVENNITQESIIQNENLQSDSNITKKEHKTIEKEPVIIKEIKEVVYIEKPSPLLDSVVILNRNIAEADSLITLYYEYRSFLNLTPLKFENSISDSTKVINSKYLAKMKGVHSILALKTPNINRSYWMTAQTLAWELTDFESKLL